MLGYPRLTIASIALLLAVTAVTASAAPQDDVRRRAESMYDALLEKNVRHLEIRQILKPYFVNEDEMSSFLIRLTRAIDEEGIYNNKIESRKVEVLDADKAYGFAETKARLEGDWLLWFNSGVEKTDRWKLVDGVWYVNPPPLENLDFKAE